MGDSEDALPTPEEEAIPREPGQQVPVAREVHDYYEPGRLAVAVGPDGLPVVAGGAPQGPEPGLTDDNLICLETLDADGNVVRPACSSYIALLRPADGVARGFGELRQIRRFCTRLATASELFEIDGDIFACSGRTPVDVRSADLIRNFEARQKQAAADAAQDNGEVDF
jgi:hypothetical protein